MSGFYAPDTQAQLRSPSSALDHTDQLEREKIHARISYERDFGALQRLLQYPELWDRRVQGGCELEMVLVDRHSMRPVDRIDGVLASYKAHGKEEFRDGMLAPRLGSEVLKSNIEADTAPLPLGAGFLGKIERQLQAAYAAALLHAEQDHPDTTVLLAGIAPTYLPDDFYSTEGLSGPADGRFPKMNQYLMGLRGGSARIQFGEVDLTVDNMTIEGSTTSFQLALSSHPDQLISRHSAALLAMGYTLAISTNAPFLTGMKGWHESRIGLLQSGVCPDRFCFKSRYDNSPEALFQDLGEYEFLPLFKTEKVSLVAQQEDGGAVPQLSSLVDTNRTVWKWLRPCYGVGDEMPHLRLEMRALPAGPTLTDMVANAAFYYGLVFGIEDQLGTDELRAFADEHAKINFELAAEHGPHSSLIGISGERQNACDLTLTELLPLARRGLDLIGVTRDEADKYLSVIAERAESGQTGSNWMMKRMQLLKEQGYTVIEANQILAKEMHQYQLFDLMSGPFPVGEWPIQPAIGE